MVTGLMLEKQRAGAIFFFSIPEPYTQQISWKCGTDNLNKKYLLINDSNVVMTFANQKLKFNASKIEKLFINESRLSSRLPCLSSKWCHSQKLQCTHILHINSGQQINMLSTFLGQLPDFILIIFINQVI